MSKSDAYEAAAQHAVDINADVTNGNTVWDYYYGDVSEAYEDAVKANTPEDQLPFINHNDYLSFVKTSYKEYKSLCEGKVCSQY